MDGLKLSDIERLISLLTFEKSEQDVITYLRHFKNDIAESDYKINRTLTEKEIKHLSNNEKVRRCMILLFLTENVALEYLRVKNQLFEDDVLLVRNIWNKIEDTLAIKLLLDRKIKSYFDNKGGKTGKEFKKYIELGKTIKIEDLTSNKFIGPNTTCSLFITGKYTLTSNDKLDQQINDKEMYDLYDRKTCCHVSLYDPFQFRVILLPFGRHIEEKQRV
jgi:hypothetical protein